jgi:AraC family transcriptional regulator
MSELLRTPRPERTRRRGGIDRPPLRLLPNDGDVGLGRDEAGSEDPASSDPGRSTFRGGLAGGALRRVKVYIDDHIGERISLGELAGQAGVSRFHFARQFRLSTGESAMEYLRRVRIERSKSILQARATSIAEVAARLGFSDQSHFTRIFGRLVGVSPGSFARCDELGRDVTAVEPARSIGLG